MNTAVVQCRDNMGQARRSRPARPWLWFALFVLAFVLLAWGGWQISQAVWAQAAWPGMPGHSFDISVNGQTWSGEALGQAAGGAVAAAVIGALLLVALLFVLPMALGAVLLGVLLVIGLVISLVALPIVLVLALVMSPLLALLGLGWLLFA